MQEYKDKVPQNIVDAITAEVANVRALGDEASAEDVKGAVSKLQVCSLLTYSLFPLCSSPRWQSSARLLWIGHLAAGQQAKR